MKQSLFSSPSAQMFRKPFNFRQPLARIDFWIFYIGHVVLSSLSVVILANLDRVVTATGGALQLLVSFLGVVWLLYLGLVMISAISRRMLDSGYYRISIAISAALLCAALTYFTKDILAVYVPGQISKTDVIVRFSNTTFALTVFWLISMGYIFLGVARPRKSLPGSEED
jgi:uncharacterized membrane protein YhaH (DUF805 family)